MGEIAHRLGIGLNALLALVKIAAGLISGSPSLLADGYHSIADLATNAVAWVSFRVASTPADDDHHFGHGKAEAVAGVFIGLVLGGAGASVLWQATSLSSPSYTGIEVSLALGTAVFSIAVNEWLVWITHRAAQRTGSHALRALARDNRSDALSSILVIVGVGGSALHVEWVEPLVTGIIGLFILVMGLRSVRESADVLMDRVIDVELRGRVVSIARAVDGVTGVQRVSAHPIGAVLHIDMEISVDGEMSVRKGHAIAHEVEEVVTRAEPTAVQVSVHVNPA
ncbi:MAG: cation transporter [bacterium]|nr:cation transporter [bacterium]